MFYQYCVQLTKWNICALGSTTANSSFCYDKYINIIGFTFDTYTSHKQQGAIQISVDVEGLKKRQTCKRKSSELQSTLFSTTHLKNANAKGKI
jgi:hypothetical protein